jgi:hypothetical protein
MELLLEYLTGEIGVEPQRVADALWRDYKRGGRLDMPGFLKELVSPHDAGEAASRRATRLPRRQSRHLFHHQPGGDNL